MRNKVIRSRAYVCGVYLLVRDGVVVYIGQSKNVYSRIAAHTQGAAFEFDAFEVELCAPEELLYEEARLIDKHMPRENKMIPAYGLRKYMTRNIHYAGEPN